MNIFRELLSTRSKNSITGLFGRDAPDQPEKLAAA
jgi:hypothetical protein